VLGSLLIALGIVACRVIVASSINASGSVVRPPALPALAALLVCAPLTAAAVACFFHLRAFRLLGALAFAAATQLDTRLALSGDSYLFAKQGLAADDSIDSTAIAVITSVSTAVVIICFLYLQARSNHRLVCPVLASLNLVCCC
jgi:hypothetical protein